MSNFISLGLLATIVVSTPQSGWLQDFDSALKVAAESERDVLVEFSGSDWCPWCKKMEAAIFGRPKFAEKAGKEYVLVKVDLPRSPQIKAQVPDFDRNQILVLEYRIETYPTILLMTADGTPYARMGFVEGGPKVFREHVEQLRQQFRPDHVEALRIIQSFAEGDEEQRAELAELALALYPKLPTTSQLLGKLAPILSQFQALDPDNASGSLARALKLLLPSGFATRQQMQCAEDIDPDNALGLQELSVLADCLTVYNKEGRLRVAQKVLKLHKLGTIRDERAAKALYANGCIWIAQELAELGTAKELGRLALPYLKGEVDLGARVRKVLDTQ
ncbi:MAG: thiol-disulfide isomerase/thioredoxin [Candidatus Paceibacteria bacterium]|jgi:thiol-disulfide isomerase/thioredoxin